MNSAVLVFTARSPKKILEQGGSQAWALDRERASNCEYLVCTQNTRTTWGDATEPHGCAFLVGRISGLTPAPDVKERWLIQIHEYARVRIADAWQGWRNPVRYTTLDAMGIDPSTLNFLPVPQTHPIPPKHLNAHSSSATGGLVHPLTIAEAKQGLAAHFQVSVDAIEIIIRG